MQAILEAAARTEAYQPSLFSRLTAARSPEAGPPKRLASTRREDPAPTRVNRLFSMTQRVQLRGGHERERRPALGRRYVASVVVSEAGDGPGRSPWSHDTITVTIAEAPRPGGPVRIVHHLRTEAQDGWRDKLPQVVQALAAGWDPIWIRAIGPAASHAARGVRLQGKGPLADLQPLSRGDRGALARSLADATAAGRLTVYRDDRSEESKGFWAQVVKAQAEIAADGVRSIFVDRGDDGYVVGLASIAAEADRSLTRAGVAIPA